MLISLFNKEDVFEDYLYKRGKTVPETKYRFINFLCNTKTYFLDYSLKFKVSKFKHL